MAEHARLSASGAHRWMKCPGSLKLEETMPDKSSSYAEEGTKAHELFEKILLQKESKEEVFYDQEMINEIMKTVEKTMTMTGEMFVEQKVNFSDWVPEGFGTADLVKINSKLKTCTVADLKYGKGVQVNAEDNEQLMLYALGVLQEFDFLYEIDMFFLYILQPRLDHFDKVILSKSRLLEFGEEVKKAAKLALSDNAPFSPGEKQCRFCKAKAICPALAEKNLEVAQTEFNNLDESLPSVESLTEQQIGKVLSHKKRFENWLKAIEEHVQEELKTKGKFTGFKLVEGRSVRAWAMDEEEIVKKLQNQKLKKNEIYEQKLITPTKAEKLLGKDNSILNKIIVKPPGKPTVAPESDKRPAINSSPELDFEVLD